MRLVWAGLGIISAAVGHLLLLIALPFVWLARWCRKRGARKERS